MKTKILTLAIIFIGAVFLFNLLEEIILKSKISAIKYSYQEITDFVIIGKTDTDYYLKGKILKEFKDKVDIEPFNLTYFKENKPVFINSKKGIYFKNENFLKLLKDVSIKTKSIKMLTESLFIYTEKNIAETKDKVLIVGNRMKTYGKGAFIDMNRDEIKVNKVKTIFEK